jgi:2-C-methyl-D-erythritol 4-phosphate cytidylyltransferase
VGGREARVKPRNPPTWLLPRAGALYDEPIPETERSTPMRVTAAILAAGSGVRLGSDTPKQLLKIAGKTVLEHTIDVFQSVDEVDEIIIVTLDTLTSTVRDIVARSNATKVSRVLTGGATRNDSTRAALRSLENEADGKLLLHDAVRPFVEPRVIRECIAALDEVDAVDVAIHSADTIIEVDHVRIEGIPERARLRRGQTPQGFRTSVLREAYRLAAMDPEFTASDDCGVVARYLPDTEIRVVEGSESNIKITHPIDVYLADKLFQLRTIDAARTDPSEIEAGLAGRHLVVFGGSRGIGAEIGAMAEAMGARSQVLSRTLTGTHVERVDEVRAALARIRESDGPIDYVVNTAGLLRIKPLAHQSDAEVEELIRVNYVGAVNVARASLPYLAETRGHLLCFTSSSFTRGRAQYSIYSSSKAAIVNLVQALAEEWTELGVRINCINPERTLTPMRVSNFGTEDPSTLLPVDRVAETSLQTLLTDNTGQVVDVRL